MKQVVVIAGPTATGKTATALAVARELEGELVGADSVQVYRGFDIGSAKPQPQELEGIPHHLVDIIDPDEAIDAAEYARRADQAIAEIHARNGLPIVVGGTGLWIRALMRGLVDLPPVDPTLRAELENRASAIGGVALHAQLEAVDPVTASAVHPHDTFRIVRALEVHTQTGIPLGKLRADHALGAPRYSGLFAVLDVEREAHRTTIEARVDAMRRAGWADEVRTLRAQWGEDVRAFGSVGYREMLMHVRDEIPWSETRTAITKATRVYARRQRTWFRGEPGVDWHTTAAEALRPEGIDRIRKALSR